MPNLESCLDADGDALYISVADVLSAFWQLPVAEGHVDRTAFVTPRGKYCFKRMPFGVANAPWPFQHVISLALGHLGPDSGILSYMGDLICINHTFESHLVSLEKMFAALHVADLTLKPSKIQFGQKEVDYLGHVISTKDISVSADRINAIHDLPTPKSIKDSRSVLGMANFVRRFVKDYSDLTAPLVELTRKSFVKRTKRPGVRHKILHSRNSKMLYPKPQSSTFPIFPEIFVVHTDASEQGVVAFLAQPSKGSTDGKELDIVAYYSKRFSRSQSHDEV